MEQTKLLFFSGSTREQSLNKKLAVFGHKIASDAGIPATFIDLRDFPMPIYDGDLEGAEGAPENAHKLKAVIADHHGIFIASPEYNSSFTPLLKNTLDWISRIPDPGKGIILKGRAVALGSATAGATGGVRSMLAVRQVLSSGIGALVLPEQMMVPAADNAFDENGGLKEARSEAFFTGVIKKLNDVAAALRNSS